MPRYTVCLFTPPSYSAIPNYIAWWQRHARIWAACTWHCRGWESDPRPLDFVSSALVLNADILSPRKTCCQLIWRKVSVQLHWDSNAWVGRRETRRASSSRRPIPRWSLWLPRIAGPHRLTILRLILRNTTRRTRDCTTQTEFIVNTNLIGCSGIC